MNLQNTKKVVVALSGGVDSSVALFLLKEKYRVEALFMNNWEENDNEQCFASQSDWKDAQSVCGALDVPLHRVNFSFEYWKNVFRFFLAEYRKGRTPNPDVWCNKKIKFDLFLKFALTRLRADFIATGHYVRTKSIHGSLHLLRGIDAKKDQSYFLHVVTQRILEKCIFPLGELTKTQVRRIADSLKLNTARKKDSVGICFVGKKNFRAFIQKYIPPHKGAIVNLQGEKIGSHNGIHLYTIGQRQGLKIGGIRRKKSIPWYVSEKNYIRNRLVAVQGRRHRSLMSVGLIVRALHWISEELPKTKPIFCTVKIRYRQNDVPCSLTHSFREYWRVDFTVPLSSVSPGQFAVFYSRSVCLGGGMIVSRLPWQDFDSNENGTISK